MEPASSPNAAPRPTGRAHAIPAPQRLGLALVFLVFGWEKLGHPESWVVYLAPSLAQFLDLAGVSSGQFFRGLALVELLIGFLLAIGWQTRPAGLLASAELAIIVGTVGLDHTGVRDLGLLLGAALPVAFLPPDRWTLDHWRREGRAPTPESGVPAGLRQAGVTAALLLLAWGSGLILFRDHPEVPSRHAEAPPILTAQARTVTSVRREPIHPIPESSGAHPAKVALGRRLFHETRLSGDETLSCASCHVLDRGGDDGLPRSRGIRGQEGAVNAPTVLNAAFNLHQFWDGRAASLRAQAADPVVNPVEMGGSWPAILAKLGRDGGYQRAFQQVYGPNGLREANVADAIAEFELTLVTPGSRFDRWLAGDDGAVTADELAGYRLFKEIGCVACHQGVNVGGNMFQTMGKFGNYFSDRGGPITPADLGRFNVTQRETDRHKFKVPGLRNVELTAPYFHDGSAGTLEDAVNTMARYQLGRRLQPSETGSIVLFLKTLTGKAPSDGAP